MVKLDLCVNFFTLPPMMNMVYDEIVEINVINSHLFIIYFLLL